MSDTAADGKRPGGESEDAAEWWDDPSLPWKHKPTKSDLVCWAMIAVAGVYGIAMLPLRAVLLGLNPPLAAMITGGRSMVVATGAWVEVHGGPLIVYWIVASLSLVKLSWIYWWAGKLWGTGIIDLWAGSSKRAKKRANRAVQITNKYWVLAVVLTFLPLPFPMPIVYAAIGAAETPLKRFLPSVIITSAVFQAGYIALGWWLGAPVVNILNIYAKYMWYVTIVILVGIFVSMWWRSRKKDAAGGKTADDDATASGPDL